MEFAGVCLVTEDVSVLRNFYISAFNVEANGDDSHTYFIFNKVHVSIFSIEGEEEIAPGSMESIGSGSCILEFGVEDVDDEFERLKSLGVNIIKQPKTQPWGIRSFWFSDPDGNIINYCCNVGNIESKKKVVK